MLVVIVLLLVWHIQWRLALSSSYPYDRNTNGVVVLMLLFNHLAYQIRWSAPVTAAFRILAWGWIAFGFFYLFYWSHVLYPANYP
jgi:hypothetical protein